MMQESISLNRQFLIMARDAARSPSGELATGLQRSLLDKIGKLSTEQIEHIAANTGASLISIRLREDELDRMVSMPAQRAQSYFVSVLASKNR